MTLIRRLRRHLLPEREKEPEGAAPKHPSSGISASVLGYEREASRNRGLAKYPAPMATAAAPQAMKAIR